MTTRPAGLNHGGGQGPGAEDGQTAGMSVLGRILMVVHSEWREKRIAPLLRAWGYDVEWCCPAQGGSLPEDRDGYAGAIVLGGVQSANDAASVDYMRRELDWIGRWAEEGRRYLGICLGGQLLAKALGARVDFHPGGLHEIGYFPIEPTSQAGDLFAGLSHVYHWHKEGFEVPAGGELLARGERFPHQAFRWRQAYGLQFHPEVTGEDVRGWLDQAENYDERPGAQPRQQHLANIAEHDPKLHRWTERFLDRWLGLSQGTTSASQAAPSPGLSARLASI